jgi:hypothetical protein
VKILLDIDGVMIPARPWQAYQLGDDGFGNFSKFSVEGLNEIIKSSENPEIILSTSHKHSFSLMEWEKIFSTRSIIKTKISRLETNSLEVSRFKEIERWYLKNQNEKFIIIDDDKGLNNLNHSIKEDHLVLTDATIGLNKPMVELAIKKINNLQEVSS